MSSVGGASRGRLSLLGCLATLSTIALTACSERELLAPATGRGELVDPGPIARVDCSADDKVVQSLVEDFEFGAAAIAYTNNEVCYRCALASETSSNFGGATSQDSDDECARSCRESQNPSSLDKPLPAALIPDQRCESNYALHIEGGPFTEWGGLIAFPFAQPIDARSYEGISFWARTRSGNRAELRVGAADPSTDSTYVDPTTGKPLCSESTTIDRYSEGCDPFGGYVNLSPNWQFFRVPFQEMRQRGFGHTARFLDLGVLRQIAFEYGQGSWDVWIDDVALYRRGDEP